MKSTIDFQAIRSNVDLSSEIEAALGAPTGGKWLCPFHADSNPSLGLTPDGQHWRCWACGAHGDVFDFVSQREHVSIGDAARRLDHSAGRMPGRRRDATPPAHRPAGQGTGGRPVPRATVPVAPAWQNADWQLMVDLVVRNGERHLWESAAGKAALAWLLARGLEEETIRRFRLGFIASEEWSWPLPVLGVNDRGKARKMRIPRGITIPWVRPGSWYSEADDGDGADPSPRWVGCNVRRLPLGDVSGRLDSGPKYEALAGSARGHCYPFADVVSGVPALVCEGEFDALLAWQETAAFVNVLTIGGTAQKPQPDATDALACCSPWLLAFDHDTNHAGDAAAWRFFELSEAKARRLWLPGTANDLTDFHRAGGNIAAWLSDEWKRFGWSWPPVVSLS